MKIFEKGYFFRFFFVVIFNDRGHGFQSRFKRCAKSPFAGDYHVSLVGFNDRHGLNYAVLRYAVGEFFKRGFVERFSGLVGVRVDRIHVEIFNLVGCVFVLGCHNES